MHFEEIPSSIIKNMAALLTLGSSFQEPIEFNLKWLFLHLNDDFDCKIVKLYTIVSRNWLLLTHVAILQKSLNHETGNLAYFGLFRQKMTEFIEISAFFYH